MWAVPCEVLAGAAASRFLDLAGITPAIRVGCVKHDPRATGDKRVNRIQAIKTFIALGVGLALGPAPAWSQAYPSRPVTLVTAFSP